MSDLYQNGPSSSDQFIRAWSLSIFGSGSSMSFTSNGAGSVNGGTSTVIDGLRIQFRTKQFMKVPTSGELDVTIYNLPSGVNYNQNLANQYNRVILQAGYLNGKFATIFDGIIVLWEHGRTPDFTETYLTIKAGTGSIALAFGIVNTTLPKGTVPADAVKKMAQGLNQYGVQTGTIDITAKTPYIRGWPAFGMPTDEILNHGHPSVTDTTLTVASLGSAKTAANAGGGYVLLNATTGLVGMAKATQNAIEATCLLNPTLKPGGLVQINNKDINAFAGGIFSQDGGTFTLLPGEPPQPFWYADTTADGYYWAVVVEHEGDSRGGPWYTHVKAWSQQVPGSNLFNYIGDATGGQVDSSNQSNPSIPSLGGGSTPPT